MFWQTLPKTGASSVLPEDRKRIRGEIPGNLASNNSDRQKVNIHIYESVVSTEFSVGCY